MGYRIFSSLQELRVIYKEGINPCIRYATSTSNGNGFTFGYCASDKNDKVLATCSSSYNGITDVEIDVGDSIYLHKLDCGFIVLRTPNPKIKLYWKFNVITHIASLTAEFMQM